MIAALLLAAAQGASPATTAIEAERAFAADAQKLGQWTAFRKWSTNEALMFTPQPVKTHDFLKDKKDPPVAIFWWPGKSFVSCDGKTAVNTGPSIRQWGKSVGYFTTVWQRQPDGGWKWAYDAGDGLEAPRAQGGDIKAVVASCNGKPRGAVQFRTIGTAGGGQSQDGTLAWSWTVGPKGERHFRAQYWNGRAYETAIEDKVAPPQ